MSEGGGGGLRHAWGDMKCALQYKCVYNVEKMQLFRIKV
jgi:hypothetical protein